MTVTDLTVVAGIELLVVGWYFAAPYFYRRFLEGPKP